MLREPIDEKGANEIDQELEEDGDQHSGSLWRCIGKLKRREKAVPEKPFQYTNLFPPFQSRFIEVRCEGYAGSKAHPRYLFVTVEGGDQNWKLSVQWGAGPESVRSPDVEFAAPERSPAQIVWRMKKELSALAAR
jgi:hypothetical protein